MNDQVKNSESQDLADAELDIAVRDEFLEFLLRKRAHFQREVLLEEIAREARIAANLLVQTPKSSPAKST